MPTPRSTAEYYRRQQRLTVQLLLAMRRTWRRIDANDNWGEQYSGGIGAQMTLLLSAAQVAATRDADAYTAAVLNELAFGPTTEPGVVPSSAFAGVTGDGRPVESLLALAVPRAGQRFNELAEQAASRTTSGASPPDEIRVLDEDLFDSLQREQEARAAETVALQRKTSAQQALSDAERWLMTVAGTVLSDTARAAESAAMVQRPWVQGYVRMLNPPSCSRCAVLAGRFYRWNTGFERHPRCDCRHIPSNESIAGDLTTSADAYFGSLTRAEQDQIFTNAGAQAIRDGADINQVVNARRGMYRAQPYAGRLTRTQVYGQKAYITLEGTTRRGQAYRALNERFRNPAADVRTAGQRYARTTNVRLMPETIYDVAENRDDAIRLLKLHGYLT